MFFDYEDLIISTTKPYVKAEMWWKPNQKGYSFINTVRIECVLSERIKL